jgi:hypothetical protein
LLALVRCRRLTPGLGLALGLRLTTRATTVVVTML